MFSYNVQTSNIQKFAACNIGIVGHQVVSGKNIVLNRVAGASFWTCLHYKNVCISLQHVVLHFARPTSVHRNFENRDSNLFLFFLQKPKTYRMGIVIKGILFLLSNEKALPWKGRPCVEKLQGVEPVGRWAGKAVNQKRKLCFDPCRCNCAQRLGYA